MKKLSKCIVLLLLALLILTSCGNKEENKGYEAIKLTDDFTFSDPEIEFTNRYSVTTGNLEELSESYIKYYNLSFKEQVEIIYSDSSDTLLESYTFYIFETEEDAAKFNQMNDSEMTVEKNIAYIRYDSEYMKKVIEMERDYAGYSGSTTKEYVEFLKTNYDMIDFN